MRLSWAAAAPVPRSLPVASFLLASFFDVRCKSLRGVPSHVPLFLSLRLLLTCRSPFSFWAACGAGSAAVESSSSAARLGRSAAFMVAAVALIAADSRRVAVSAVACGRDAELATRSQTARSEPASPSLLAGGHARRRRRGWLCWPHGTLAMPAGPEALVVDPSRGGGGPPDIYVILLDGYPRADTLARLFDFDNGPFLAALEAKGFDVSAGSSSNYMYTELTLDFALSHAVRPGHPRSLGCKGPVRLQPAINHQ